MCSHLSTASGSQGRRCTTGGRRMYSLDVAAKRPEKEWGFRADPAPDSGTSAALLLCKYIQNMNYVNAKCTHAHTALQPRPECSFFAERPAKPSSFVAKVSPFSRRILPPTRNWLLARVKVFVFPCLTIFIERAGGELEKAYAFAINEEASTGFGCKTISKIKWFSGGYVFHNFLC